MDEDMWKHPSTKANVQRLREYGNHIIPTEFGSLASGLTGEGRMTEPETMVTILSSHFDENHLPLTGIQALVTAGPTYERIDPVRFIGNFSTGKMGVCIAEALAAKGATVTLIAGPGVKYTNHHHINVTEVESATEMYGATMKIAGNCQVMVLAAAVADYRPDEVAVNKIKKGDAGLVLHLTKTDDILASLGKIKAPQQTLVGFALETDNEVTHATKKLNDKNADMIVLNSLRDAGAGFGHDTNKVTMLCRNHNPIELPLQSKTEVAKAIVEQIIAMRHVEKTA
jgi:phosphopantothenoylcysteine decarboxylase/phosphopantothenate--cysteine ligase